LPELARRPTLPLIYPPSSEAITSIFKLLPLFCREFTQLNCAHPVTPQQ
jgi:hypothetical protein